MIERLLDWTASLTLRRPVAVLVGMTAATVLLVANTRHLQLRTDVTDLVGRDTASGRALREYIQEFGYGNRLFVIVQSPGAGEPDPEPMEEAADRLVREMRASGRFSEVRSEVSEAEMLQIARFYVERFPAFADAKRREELAQRLSPAGARARLRQSAERFLTSFSTLGPQYFALDPLGLLDLVDPSSRSGGGFSGFDLEWGSGGRFFSRDHRALLLIAEPNRPASDYEFAVGLMSWLRERIATIRAETPAGAAPLEIVPVGAHAYADQNRALVERNIRVASLVSVLGNLLLVFLVYRWLPAVVLSVLPTFLALLWTTGLISTYPGEINLITLAFIAILAGLGDDQVTYFFTRVPQEIAAGRSLAEAIRATYVTTGKSAFFCVFASSLGTLALAASSFKGLAELGLVLTIGLAMVLVHTLFTVPAVIFLVWPAFPVRTEGGPFRLLPTVARAAGAVVARQPGRVVVAGATILLAACAAIPAMRTRDRFESFTRYDDPAFVGQRLLASRFGLEGAPLVLLVQGTEQEVLARTAALQAELPRLPGATGIRSLLAPNGFVPSREQQSARAEALVGLDWGVAATTLDRAGPEVGLAPAVLRPVADLFRRWARGGLPVVTVDEARRSLPSRLLDDSIRELGPDHFVGAVTLYSGAADATASLPAETLARLRERAGRFTAFSYDQIAIDLEAQIRRDSRRASLLAAVAVIAVVVLIFRSVRLGLLALLPIGYGLVVTVGILALTGHRFGAMGFAAFPLIAGIGIDNSIHLVRRHLETRRADPERLLTLSGAALIQTNLTTIIGFGALVSATIPPLAELGLITAVGITFTLLASLTLLPAVLQLAWAGPTGRPANRCVGGGLAEDDGQPPSAD